MNTTKKLLDACQASAEALEAAQGEYQSVDELHAPEWTHQLKEAANQARQAIAAEQALTPRPTGPEQTDPKKAVAFTVTLLHDITVSDVDMILTTCFEGGSNYWINKVKLYFTPPPATCASKAVAHGGTIIIVSEHQDGDGLQEDHLTLYKLKTGVGLYLAAHPEADPKTLAEDGDSADSVLQMALFGEVIYG